MSVLKLPTIQRGCRRSPNPIGTDASAPTINPIQTPVMNAWIPYGDQGVITIPKQAGSP